MDSKSLAAFGDLLRRHRAAAGLTQEELAERAGVSIRTIGDLERGVSTSPHRDTIGLLAQALELTGDRRGANSRSEEHTSELQSRFDLVCRLLLEKKKLIKFSSYLSQSNRLRLCNSAPD